MSATRTQVYLTEAQRRRLDERCRLRGISLAEAVREAVDLYIAGTGDACQQSLDDTFGTAPKIEVPGRDEWARDGLPGDGLPGDGPDCDGPDCDGPDGG